MTLNIIQLIMHNYTTTTVENKTPLLRFVKDGTFKVKSRVYNVVFDVGRYEKLMKHQLIYQMNNGRLDEVVEESENKLLGDSQREDIGGEIKTVKPHSYIRPMGGILKSILGSSENDIKSFLRKPIVNTSGTFGVADGPATFPIQGLFRGLDETIRSDKLKGVFSIRADTVITLEINGNPFQNGRYILASIPSGGALNTAANTVLRCNAHRFSRVQITQLNHVQADIATDKQVQLYCPFISGMSSHNISSGNNYNKQGNPGWFFIYPYLPLEVVTGSTTVPYTLWIHYENVELFGSAIPQMGKRGRFAKGDLLQDEVTDGPYTRTLSLATDMSSALSNVPILSSIMGPLSFVTNAAANVARHFGWSKSLLLDKPIRTNNHLAPFIANSDQVSLAQPLSLMSNNHVSALPGFAGSDLDELSIDFIKSIPSYFGSFTWPYTSAVGTVLYGEFTDPSKYYINSTDGISSLTSFTPVGFLGTLFNQWQGSLIITLKFSKTMFHAGRLAFCYNLHDPATAPAVISYATLPYTHKEIIDITKGNEFSFEIPYIANTEWSFSAAGLDAGQLSPGEWALIVIDPLIYTSTVPNAIRAVMEVSGGKSLHFAVPRPFEMCPTSIVNFQSGNVMKEELVAINEPIVGTRVVENYLTSCENSVGEVVDSLRLLLKRGGHTYCNGLITGTTGFYIAPHITNWLENHLATTPDGYACMDPYNLISSFYCLGRGGYRMHFMTGGGVTSAYSMFVWLQTHNNGLGNMLTHFANTTQTYIQATYRGNGSGVSILRGGELQGVQSPQHLLGHSRNLLECTAFGVGGAVSTEPSSPMIDRLLIFVKGMATFVGQNLYRSVADDHSLGGFISIPPMYYVSV